MVSVYEVERDKMGDGEIVANNLDIHLCDDCRVSLIKYLTQPVMEGEPTEELEEEQPTKKAGNKNASKKLDTGKIKALWEAGWSTKQIADEMGVCSKTITNYMKRDGIIR